MTGAPKDFATFEANASLVANILRTLANERRLMILCKLAEWGEASVSGLSEAAGLSQSATSQHLAKMRDEGLVEERLNGGTTGHGTTPARNDPSKDHRLSLVD